jgi:hypothetical protein
MSNEIARSSTSLARRYGPWAVVTGASDGIGRGHARVLAREGVAVVLVARRGERLAELAAELRGAFGAETRVVIADLATRTGIDAVLEATSALDVGLLVQAAGFGPRAASSTTSSRTSSR